MKDFESEGEGERRKKHSSVIQQDYFMPNPVIYIYIYIYSTKSNASWPGFNPSFKHPTCNTTKQSVCG